MEIDKLHSWLQENSIDHHFIHERVFVSDEKKYLLLLHKQGKIFNPNMALIIEEQDLIIMDDYQPDYFVTYFGDKFYYFGENDFKSKNLYDEVGDVVGEELTVRNILPLLYIGKCVEQEIFPLLGVHGGYDICNGFGSYKDWCKKAKWLGITTLGICEENTLAGTLLFQEACKKAGIKSIIGETITIQHSSSSQYQIKLYCANMQGWRNLLQINALLNTHQEKSIDFTTLFKYSEGLICVLNAHISLKEVPWQEAQKHFDHVYYQCDYTEWTNITKEEEWLMNLYEYFEFFYKQITPIALYDCFYLEQQDAELQPVVWRIGKREGLKYRSSDRYFKTSVQYRQQAQKLFGVDSYHVIDTIIANTQAFNDITFEIPIGEKHLPQYELTQDQFNEFQNSENLFWHLIESGLQSKVIDKGLDPQPYIERIQEEVRVIELGQVRDYFLIVWDILNFCKSNGILTGIGRGSAAGCLISYLLGIVQIDPLHYNLLFERFLNEGRVGKSLPDIDNDIMGSRREEVKRYIEQKYGVDYVAGIGTYGTFKVRAALKDMIREIGGDSREANYISAILDPEDNFFNVIEKAMDPGVNTRLYTFIKKHAFQINQIPTIFQQPKTQSVHAAGIIIVPKSGGEIYQQLPVKTMDGIVMTEWEGGQIEEAGFLKVDVLGLKQLDKFDEIIKLIKDYRGVDIELLQIPLDEPGVYKFFSEGFNEDVFQFGGGGLKTYCKVLRPDNIEDLIATVALYRPGPIEIGAHERYAKIKNGELEPSYYYNLEEITKATYSQIVYQEQIMLIVQSLGGFTLVEADDIRKAMGKKLPEVMMKYKQQFVSGAVERGCPENEALQLWADMEGFAGYAFNRSHAACYGITGYYSQWFKYTYPLEFWLTSLKYSSDKEIQARLAEIRHIAERISISSPDVLKSKRDYFGDTETNTIYWSLASIKHVGEAALQEIERLREGRFINSLEDFVELVKEDKELKKAKLQPGERIYSPINRRVICNLIIAGAFDRLNKITHPAQRGELLKEYFALLYPELKTSLANEKAWEKRMVNYYPLTLYKDDYKWIMEQRAICGFGTIDFRNLLLELPYTNRGLFIENNDVLLLNSKSDKVIVGGIVESVILRSSRKGAFAQVLLHDGFSELYVTVWPEVYSKNQELIDNSKGKLLFIDGTVVLDSYRKHNVVHSAPWSTVEILQ